MGPEEHASLVREEHFGGLMFAAFTRDGHACVYYRAPNGGDHVGWLSAAQIEQVSPDTFPADWRTWTDGLPERPWPRWATSVLNSPGRSVRPYSFTTHLELLQRTDDRLRFDVDEVCGRSYCLERPFNVPFVNARLAQDDLTTLVLFDNALFFRGSDGFGSDWRIFYPEPRPPGAVLRR